MRTGVSPKRITTGSFLLSICHITYDSLKDQQQFNPYFFLRKEVIQPHLPIRLPCYDFTPVTGPAFGGCFPLLDTIVSFRSSRNVFPFLPERVSIPPGTLFVLSERFSSFRNAFRPFGTLFVRPGRILFGCKISSKSCPALFDRVYQGLAHRLRAFPTPMV